MGLALYHWGNLIFVEKLSFSRVYNRQFPFILSLDSRSIMKNAYFSSEKKLILSEFDTQIHTTRGKFGIPVGTFSHSKYV